MVPLDMRRPSFGLCKYRFDDELEISSSLFDLDEDRDEGGEVLEGSGVTAGSATVEREEGGKVDGSLLDIPAGASLAQRLQN